MTAPGRLLPGRRAGGGRLVTGSVAVLPLKAAPAPDQREENVQTLYEAKIHLRNVQKEVLINTALRAVDQNTGLPRPADTPILTNSAGGNMSLETTPPASTTARSQQSTPFAG